MHKISSNFVGLGLRLNQKLQVTEIVLGGPCDSIKGPAMSASQVLVDDFITHINDDEVKGKLPEQITHLTSGPVGSSVTLKLHRDSIPGSVEVAIQRKFVQVLDLKDIIRQQIEMGLRKRDDNAINEIFNQYADNTKHIPKEELVHALKSFDVAKEITHDDVENVGALFRSLDRNGDGLLDSDEFKYAVQAPSQLEHWTLSFPLHQLLADAIPHRVGDEPLRAASKLTSNEIDTIVEEFKATLKVMLTEKVEELANLFREVRNSKRMMPATKFEAEILPKMKCGNIEDFHKGIVARIGNAALNFEVAMGYEHCDKGECDFEFTSSNHQIKTRPCLEWQYIVESASKCPEEQRPTSRKIPDLKELEKLEKAVQAKLTRAEIIALVLYTGPMFYIYNAILRRSPEEIFKKFKDVDNLFPCTIFVLASAVQKLSRITTLHPNMVLYRGLKGTVDLPELFYKCDRHGCTGFTEWGFMSTTTKLNMALFYSGVSDETLNSRTARVFRIQVGSVDRGASIKEFSQYPDEDEYIYVPCSFVASAGEVSIHIVPGSGIVEIVPVKVNSNFKAPTVEEVIVQKKDAHIAAFVHRIDHVQHTLHDIAKDRQAETRLEQDKSAKGEGSQQLTVKGFLERIVSQCKEVLSRHQAIQPKDYTNDRLFRSLNMEMIDTTTTAVTKLEEWLENTSGSFIRYRWNLPLPHVQRRWRSYLEVKGAIAETSEEKTAASLRLCKALDMVYESVSETNEVGETRLMCAAADGRSGRFLKLLVAAGAEVDQATDSGVTALWLAAQGGHDHCAKTLVGLNADVNKAVNDGTTPLGIAARNGKWDCAKMLVNLNARVDQADIEGTLPVHQAALYGWDKTLTALVECKADINATNKRRFTPWHMAKMSGHEECADIILQKLGGKKTDIPKDGLFVKKNKRLIISTGDISDIDGFLALVEYAKLGSDVIFVMNYPAYIGESEVDDQFAERNPGLGYKYTAQQVLESVKNPSGSYTAVMERYQGSANERVKAAMTDLAFAMAHEVWNEVPNEGKGELLFYIGGVNAINPFSCTAIKNEVLTYAEHVKMVRRLEPVQGVVYDSNGDPTTVQWEEYSDIYMDFNGSLAFWDGHLTSKLSEDSIVKKCKAVFIMGGVYADVPPVTMPSIQGVLNRFSSATMNQLYHPQKAANFLAFLGQFHIPTFTVTNNVVGNLGSMDGVDSFLTANGLTGKSLRVLAHAHYGSQYNPPKKPFDYYTACAMKALIEDEKVPVSQAKKSPGVTESGGPPGHVFISNVYGITLVSRFDTWEETKEQYAKVVDTEVQPGDDERTRAKKESFRKEIDIMKSVHYLASIAVEDLEFEMDDVTKFLKLRSRV